MVLTPVRIRGKKNNRTAVKSAVSKARILTAKPTSSKASNPVKKYKALKKAVPAMPTLQGLPQELLELIFLHSMNLNLVHASPNLGRKLSSKAIIMEFVMQSFFRSVDHWVRIKNHDNDHTVFTGHKTLQSELLSFRFFDWPFFLSYVNKAHDEFVTVRGNPWKSLAVPDASAFDGLWPFRFTKIEHLGFAKGFHVPEKLLRGPWTASKASLLYVLVSFSAEIDWEGGMAGETAKDGLKEAIREGNEHAVAALSVLLGIANAITTDTILFAATHSGSNDNIIRHLLFNAQILYDSTPRDALDFYDPSLWAWADSQAENVAGNGEVFKNMLRDAEKFSLEFYRQEETDWTKIVPFPYSGTRFDTRMRLNRFSRELLAKLYQNYGRKLTTRAPGGRRARSIPRGILRHDPSI